VKSIFTLVVSGGRQKHRLLSRAHARAYARKEAGGEGELARGS